jgi:hypothetical protein
LITYATGAGAEEPNAAGIAGAADTAPAIQTAQANQPATAAPPEEEITVTAKRLEAARIGIEPQIGASTFSF